MSSATKTPRAALEHGHRLDLPSGTRHAATVGPDGCLSIEAAR